jgi:hypothetical protein
MAPAEGKLHLSTDVRNWTLCDIETWTPGLIFAGGETRGWGGLSR